jgi:hypothetical protein
MLGSLTLINELHECISSDDLTLTGVDKPFNYSCTSDNLPQSVPWFGKAHQHASGCFISFQLNGAMSPLARLITQERNFKHVTLNKNEGGNAYLVDNIYISHELIELGSESLTSGIINISCFTALNQVRYMKLLELELVWTLCLSTNHITICIDSFYDFETVFNIMCRAKLAIFGGPFRSSASEDNDENGAMFCNITTDIVVEHNLTVSGP